ncbi:MAG: folylpolyglutamate synthase/dihydrofolate synthase family protein [Dermatophilaceae bacterium]
MTSADLTARLAEVELAILARAPENDVEPTLDQIRAVMELLGDPQFAFPVIHVTGTNGKTSTVRLIEAVCRELGLTTGRFTSPHLHTMRERICIAGEPISVDGFVAAYDEAIAFIEMVEARDGVRMNFFQTLVAMAYIAFADAPVHVAIVEVGLGGSWDATNIADGQVAVVTPVDLDHTRLLGSTIEAIATEKAGIIKPGAIAVSGVQDPSVGAILAERAEQVGARILFEGIDFGVTGRDVALGGQLLSVRGLAGDYDELFLPLHGEHMASNAAVAVAAVEAFLGGGERRLDPDVLRAGLAASTSPGRLEIVRRSPTVLVDAAHNPHGMRALRGALTDAFTFTTLVGVVAIFSDKPAAEMLEELEPVLDAVVVTRNSSPRSTPPRELGEVAVEIFGESRVHVVNSLPDAVDTAVAIAEADGLGGGVIATGSVVTAADVRRLLGVTSL